MKTRKTLLALALVTTLGLTITSCDNSDAPTTSVVESSTVTRITANAPDYVIVGTVFDLDEYVTLMNGNTALESKDYVAEIAAASASVATIEGHVVTVVASGSLRINISLTNSTLRASFSTNAVSELWAEYYDYVADIDTDYLVIGAISAEEAEEEFNIPVEEGASYFSNWGFGYWVHDSNYFGYYDGIFSSTGEGNVSGLLKAGDGRTYEWQMDDPWGTNFEVIPGPLSYDLSLYYLASPFALGASNVSDGTFNGEDALVVSAAGVSNFDQTALGIAWGSTPTVYITMEDVEYANVTGLDAAGDPEGETIVVHVPVVHYTFASASGASQVAMELAIVKDTAADAEVAYEVSSIPVDAYIESGESPAPVIPTRVNEAVAKLAEAQSFTVTAMGAWMDLTDGSLYSSASAFDDLYAEQIASSARGVFYHTNLDANHAIFSARTYVDNVNGVVETTMSGYDHADANTNNFYSNGHIILKPSADGSTVSIETNVGYTADGLLAVADSYETNEVSAADVNPSVYNGAANLQTALTGALYRAYEEGTDAQTATVELASDANGVLAALVNYIPYIGDDLAAQLTYEFDDGEGGTLIFGDYFEINFIVDNTAGAETITAQMLATWPNSIGYFLQVQISNIDSTVAPSAAVENPDVGGDETSSDSTTEEESISSPETTTEVIGSEEDPAEEDSTAA